MGLRALSHRIARLAGRGRSLSRGDRLELVESLADPGCPACRARDAAVAHWFFIYQHESNGEWAVKQRMERSFGLCAPHSRRLLGLGPASSWLAKGLFATVAAAGVRALDGAEPDPPATCPPCASGGAAEVRRMDHLAMALSEASAGQVTDAVTYYRSGDGLCLPHARVFALRAADAGRPEVLGPALDQLVAGLRHGPEEALRRLTGVDPDLARRTRPRQEREVILEAEDKARTAGADGYADHVLAQPCCPVCATADRALWRFLLEPSKRGTSKAERAGPMCPTHLGDLAEVDVTDGWAPAVERAAAHWRERLEAVTAAERAPSVRTVRAAVGHPPECGPCRTRAEAISEEWRTLGRCARDRSWADRVAEAHGVCLRHRGSSALPDPFRALLRRRIGRIADELEEARRKDTWDARWEEKGEEATSWRRAPALLDGGILGPAQ